LSKKPELEKSFKSTDKNLLKKIFTKGKRKKLLEFIINNNNNNLIIVFCDFSYKYNLISKNNSIKKLK
jgi:hypothetical protein